ncbi:MAG: site-2 protease family protein [Planctomycetia bacterium]|jgi:regulator of sigma E protease
MDNFFVFGFWLFDPDFLINALQVAIGLGLVIFVHELGHFVVAKLCGVRCDKFYIGFDIGGWKFCKFKAGETEYGIGILPLGGYVKMLGQEDNPGRLKEEIQRAKAGQAPLDTPEGEEVKPLSEKEIKELEDALYDPRSYLAQSVPKRMAIISAGVIMNLIFAFVVACIAYGIGVEKPVCGVGSLHPGDSAWQAGLKPGDMIVKINDQPVKQFRDLQEKVALSDAETKKNGIPFVVKRPGVKEPMSFVILPNLDRQAPTIGVTSPSGTSVIEPREGFSFIQPLSAASKAEPELKPGDTFVEINGRKIKNNADLHEALALEREKPLEVTLERIDPKWDPKKAKKGEKPKTITLKTQIPVQPLVGVGLVMKMAPITAIRSGSPAEQAGLKPGDLIKAIDGKDAGDPMTLETRLRHRTGETITLTVERKDKSLEIPVTVGPDDTWSGLSLSFNNSMLAVPELGIAIRVPREVAGVLPDSPAAKAGIKPGQKIKLVTMIPPKKEEVAKYFTKKEIKKLELEEKELDFETDKEKKKISWPDVFNLMQSAIPGMKFEFTFTKGKPVTLVPVPLEGRFNPNRGIVFKPTLIHYQAETFGQSLEYGADETLRQTTLIFRFLDRLFSGDISPTNLAGPGTIVAVASDRAEAGFSEFLLFLTLLSANLAVVNFLPIPVLDGGHMVFLTYELIFRKPANETVQIVLSYIGLLFILGLMLWVIGLDIMRFVS